MTVACDTLLYDPPAWAARIQLPGKLMFGGRADGLHCESGKFWGTFTIDGYSINGCGGCTATVTIPKDRR